MRQFTRSEILERFQKKIRENKPIIMGGAGIGLIASIAEEEGIDMIMSYCTGAFRMDGNPSLLGRLPYSNCNDEALKLSRILANVDRTPVTAGISCQDPYRSVEMIVDLMMSAGFSGIINCPSISGLNRYDTFENNLLRRRVDEGNLGFDKELRMVDYCREKDIFTVVYAYTIEDARAFAAHGCDAIGLHVGGTSGGDVGQPNARSMDLACELVNKMDEAAKEENPNVITLAHGGPFEGPGEVQECFRQTSVHGFMGASSVERLPTERAIVNEVKKYKTLRLK